MSNFIEITNQVLRRAGQESASSLAAASSPVQQTMDFINEVYFDVLQAAQCHFLETNTTFNTSNGTALYTLASDADVNFLLKDRIRETTSDSYLSEADPAMMLASHLGNTGKPIRFWVEGTKLRLHPIPDGAYTIEYYYLKRPTKLANDTDSLLIPLAWEHLLIRGAQSLLEKFLGEVENSRISYSLYLEGLALLKSKAHVKPHHQMKGFYRGYQGG